MTVYTPKVIVQPSEELLTITECREHLNIDAIDVDSDGVYSHPDDDLIMALQGAAREHCESFLGMSLARRTLEIAMDKFPAGAIELPMPPLLLVQSIMVGLTSDGEVDPDTYTVDDYSTPSRVVPVTTWPTVTASTNLVRVRYLVGYGEDSDGAQPLPYAIRAAMLLVLGHLYKNREDSTDKAMESLPGGAMALMRPLRVLNGMA